MCVCVCVSVCLCLSVSVCLCVFTEYLLLQLAFNFWIHLCKPVFCYFYMYLKIVSRVEMIHVTTVLPLPIFRVSSNRLHFSIELKNKCRLLLTSDAFKVKSNKLITSTRLRGVHVLRQKVK